MRFLGLIVSVLATMLWARSIHSAPLDIPPDLRVIGRIGDNSYGVAIHATHAYVGQGGAGLSIFDTSDPTHSTLVSTLSEPAAEITVAGRYAYVGAGTAGLRVIDISDPTQPSPLGVASTPSPFQHQIVFSNGYVYIANADAGLRIFDVSNPSRPTEVNAVAVDDATGIAIDSHYLYLVDSTRRILVLDVTDPAIPLLVSSYPLPGTAISVAGSRGYVAGVGGLYILDISDPLHPNTIGKVSTANGRRIDVQDKYVALSTGDGLYLVDVADNSKPRLVGYFLSYQAGDVAMSNRGIYLSELGRPVVILALPQSTHAYLPIVTKRSHTSSPTWFSEPTNVRRGQVLWFL